MKQGDKILMIKRADNLYRVQKDKGLREKSVFLYSSWIFLLDQDHVLVIGYCK